MNDQNKDLPEDYEPYNFHSTSEEDEKKKYYENILLREQPFYRKGMTNMEAETELRYLNDNLKDFYEGNYKPLWKQNLFN